MSFQTFPYNVPLPSALPTPTAPTFEFRLDQIVKIAFQMPGTPFASEAAMKDQDTWDTLTAATNATKIVLSPLFSNNKIDGGDAIMTQADSNLTVAGIPELFGNGISKFSAEFRGKDSASVQSMRDLTQFSLQNSIGLTSLCGYLINKDGMLFCNADFSPIPIWNFNIADLSSDGLNTNNVYKITFQLAMGWNKTIVPVIPDFDIISYAP